jgi:hypothetical protein
LELNQSSYAAVLGFYLAYLVIKTGSIFSSILAHFVINGSQAVGMYFIMHFEEVVDYLRSMTDDPATLRQLQEMIDVFQSAQDTSQSVLTPEQSWAEIVLVGRQLIFVLPILILLLIAFTRHCNRVSKRWKVETKQTALETPEISVPEPEGEFSYRDYLESRGVIEPSENKINNARKKETRAARTLEKTSKVEVLCIAAAVLVFIIVVEVIPFIINAFTPVAGFN